MGSSEAPLVQGHAQCRGQRHNDRSSLALGAGCGSGPAGVANSFWACWGSW